MIAGHAASLDTSGEPHIKPARGLFVSDEHCQFSSYKVLFSFRVFLWSIGLLNDVYGFMIAMDNMGTWTSLFEMKDAWVSMKHRHFLQ